MEGKKKGNVVLTSYPNG